MTDQSSLPDCLYFLRYWAICVLKLFSPVWEVTNLEIHLSFLIGPFSYMTKKSGQTFKYLKNGKSF